MAPDMELIDEETWADWLFAAHQHNAYKPPDQPNVGRRDTASGPPGDDLPGTDFNRRASWEDTGLFDAGWAWVRRAGEDKGLVRRPGKERGVSGSVGMTTSQKNGWEFFHCWSTNAVGFRADVSYTKFAVYAAIFHNNDFKAAAAALREKGFGKDKVQPQATFSGFIPPENKASDPDRMFRWMSELRRQREGTKWLWEGLVSRGGVSLFSALWKIGKTTLLGHLVRAFDGRSTEFLGLPITPSKILYVTEEHEELWAERRDDLGIADHVGMVCRPFRGRSSMAEWQEFVGKLAKTVSEHQFDLVVMDTISKLWPVKEENDAGQVEEALMPLWTITNMGAVLFLVHHTRKSGGTEFTGSRGSGGLPAFCETLVEFRRDSEDTKDAKRVLHAKGRYRETPDKLLIELTPAGYVSHGDPDDPTVKATFSGKDWKPGVLEKMPSVPPGWTLQEVIQSISQGVRRVDVKAWLDERVTGGEMLSTGTGTKGDPLRWHLVG